MPHIQLPYGITDYNNKQIKLNLLKNDKSKVLFSQLPYLANFKNLFFKVQLKMLLRWCRARDLFGSQIPVTTVQFELRISCIRSSYLTHRAIRPIG